MEREFDAYKLSRCMCPSKYNRFWDTARYSYKKSEIFHTPLYSTPQLGGSRRNIGTPFGMGKLEWCRYPMVKKFRRYLYSIWRTDGRTDVRTDWHRVKAYTALMHMHRAVKTDTNPYSWPCPTHDAGSWPQRTHEWQKTMGLWPRGFCPGVLVRHQRLVTVCS